ncbi:MAG: MBL fold metallo-hydrolase [Candidatus Thorarchaeota archaeon]|jgi:glyoxylase-like metal-dependent hydrolase (beta-lactamase superfamily II)
MVLERIAERVYADTTGDNAGHFGAIVLSDEIILVDSGLMHTKSLQVRKQLERERGLPINKMLLTHYHGDHIFGAQAFEPLTIISSTETRDICVRNLEGRWRKETMLQDYSQVREERPELWEALQDLRILIPKETFVDEITLGEKDDITMIHLGGHTAGSSIVVVEPEHVVFVGDLIFNRTFPYAGDPTCNPDKWIEALEEIARRDFVKVIPGHGPMCEDNDVEDQLEFLRALRTSVKKALKDGASQQEFIEQGLDPDHDMDGRADRLLSAVTHWYSFYGK